MTLLKIKRLIGGIRDNIILIYAKALYSHLPVINNKIVIDNFLGKGYGDNPKYICEALLKRKLDLDIVWVTKDASVFPDGIRTVKYGTIKALKEYYTAHIWIDNVRNSFKPSKRRNQFYIQTWHGNLGNKRVEGAAVDSLSKDYLKSAKKDASQTDLMISGSTFFTNLIKEYFWYTGEIYECGTPRLDILFSDFDAITCKVKEYYEISNDTKIILYAPTFRANNSLKCYDLDYLQIVESFEKLYGCKCALLIRFHPNVNTKELKVNYSCSIFDATKYEDVYELIVSSAAIITDYSSISFEAGIINKPVFVYANDLDNYIEERGFYFDVYQQPFPISTDQVGLNRSIVDFNYSVYEQKLKTFNSKLDIKEFGNASFMISDRILSLISNKN